MLTHTIENNRDLKQSMDIFFPCSIEHKSRNAELLIRQIRCHLEFPNLKITCNFFVRYIDTILLKQIQYFSEQKLQVQNKERLVSPNCIAAQNSDWCTLLPIEGINHSHIGVQWGEALLT